MAINADGQVVGSAADIVTGDQHAVIWTDGSAVEISPLGGPYSSANAINDTGTVVGESTISARIGDTNEVHAFVWDRGDMRDLGMAGRNSSANAINAAGTIVGYEGDNLGNPHAMLWQDGVGHRLDHFDVGFSTAVAINDARQVVLTAYASGAGGIPRSYMSEDGPLTGLGPFQATALNASGQVIGYQATPLPEVRPLLWDGAGVRYLADSTTLGLPIAINDRGEIVGSTWTDDGIEHAVIWDGSAAHDLNTGAVQSSAGWELARATAINNAGQIVGFGLFEGELRAFLLTPQ